MTKTTFVVHVIPALFALVLGCVLGPIMYAYQFGREFAKWLWARLTSKPYHGSGIVLGSIGLIGLAFLANVFLPYSFIWFMPAVICVVPCIIGMMSCVYAVFNAPAVVDGFKSMPKQMLHGVDMFFFLCKVPKESTDKLDRSDPIGVRSTVTPLSALSSPTPPSSPYSLTDKTHPVQATETKHCPPQQPVAVKR